MFDTHTSRDNGQNPDRRTSRRPPPVKTDVDNEIIQCSGNFKVPMITRQAGSFEPSAI